MYNKGTETGLLVGWKSQESKDYISALQTTTSTWRIVADNAAMKATVAISADDPKQIAFNF